MGAIMKVITGAVLVCLFVVGETESTTTCSEVSNDIYKCLVDLKGSDKEMITCCSGVESINTAESTTAYRQAACACFKTLATTINYNLTSTGLAGECADRIISLDEISSTTDCTKVT